MNIINYEPTEIRVKIDGEEYVVAERTAVTDEKLQEHNANIDNMTNYEASYDLVRILLGEEACKKIFPKGKEENLTRMYVIAKGVDNAYSAEYQNIRDKEYEEVMNKVDKMAERSKPVIEMIDKTNQQRRNKKNR